MDRGRVEEALDATGHERLDLVAKMTGQELQAFLAGYNWDDGIDTIRTLVRNPQCELAVALEAFWLTDPDLTTVPPAPGHDEDYNDLVREIYDGILVGRFPVRGLKFDPMAGVVGARTQRYILEKRGLAAIFLDPVGGSQEGPA